MGAPQYQGMWIQVPTLNGDPIMGSSSAQKILGATITKLKPKNVGKIVRRIEKRKKMPLLKLDWLLGKYPTRLK
jgi:hypothetical protein